MNEQNLYARWLDHGVRVSLALLVACFLAYVLRLVEPLVPLEALPAAWLQPVDRYLAATGAPTGWGWLAALDKGDYLNYLGFAALCLTTLVCYLRVVPSYLRAGDRAYAGIALAQVLVLLAAASGWLAGGH